MNNFIFIPFIFLVGLLNNDVLARDLKATANKLGQEASEIGFALSIFGLALGGIYLIVGRQDATAKITQTVFGIIILASSTAIINLIKNIS